MSVQLDAALANTGTKFRIFPQPRFLPSFSEPEEVVVSIPAGQVTAGPADRRMFVVDAVNKRPYSQFNRPPFTGRRNPPVRPGPAGHFDHLVPGTREFACATMYATVRRVLDIWEDYFGHHIPWHFESQFARLELIPLIVWDNAQSGFGFLEFGFGRTPAGGIDRTRPFCENFDVLAHELGHSLVFSQVGVPTSPADPAVDYGGLHEASGDLVAIIASLHFHSVVNHLLSSTKGNLFSVNELERVGELSASREIRSAFNNVRMSDVGDEPHERSLPLTGGVFDVLVEVFQKELVARDLISGDLARRSTQGPDGDPDLDAIKAGFEEAFEGNDEAFKEALLAARDYTGRLLARAYTGMNPNFLTYHDVLRRLLAADRQLDPAGDGIHQDTIRECFAWREIELLPGSMLTRQHTVRACQLAADALVVPDGLVREVTVRVAEQMAADNGNGKHGSADAPAPAAKATPAKKAAATKARV